MAISPDIRYMSLHDPAIPLAKPENQGRNEGMSIVEELDFDATSESKPVAKEGDSPRQTIASSDVTKPISIGWSCLFTGGDAALAFSGIVGGVLRAFGVIAVTK